MSLAAAVLVILLPCAAAVLAPASPPTEGMVGVTYNMNTPGLRPPAEVAEALVAAGVTRVLLMDPYPDGIAAFNATGIALTIAINNSVVRDLGVDPTHCYVWIGDNIILPNVNVEAISVGYDIFSRNLELADYLLPAIKNLNNGLNMINPNLRIAVTTVNSYDLISPPFPPSAAEFNGSVAELYLKPLLTFLDLHKFPFFIALYPFKLYRSGIVPGADIGFAAMDTERGTQLTDPTPGLVYDNLFDAMVDATASAIAKLGFPAVRVVVSSTGWPSGGGINEPEASVLYAGEYNERLVGRLNMELGTPARPDTTPVTFIYALFDHPNTSGAESERNWGIWTTDLQQKYVIDFTPSQEITSGAFPSPILQLHAALRAAVAAILLLLRLPWGLV